MTSCIRDARARRSVASLASVNGVRAEPKSPASTRTRTGPTPALSQAAIRFASRVVHVPVSTDRRLPQARATAWRIRSCATPATAARQDADFAVPTTCSIPVRSAPAGSAHLATRAAERRHHSLEAPRCAPPGPLFAAGGQQPTGWGISAVPSRLGRVQDGPAGHPVAVRLSVGRSQVRPTERRVQEERHAPGRAYLDQANDPADPTAPGQGRSSATTSVRTVADLHPLRTHRLCRMRACGRRLPVTVRRHTRHVTFRRGSPAAGRVSSPASGGMISIWSPSRSTFWRWNRRSGHCRPRPARTGI